MAKKKSLTKTELLAEIMAERAEWQAQFRNWAAVIADASEAIPRIRSYVAEALMDCRNIDQQQAADRKRLKHLENWVDAYERRHPKKRKRKDVIG